MKQNYTILAIDTSCDETSVAVTVDDRVIANVVSSQVQLHKKYGGVVPMLAQRAHKENIDAVIQEALNRYVKWCKTQRLKDAKIQNINYLSNIDCIAVTIGPGLAPALQVGVAKARELAVQFGKPLIAVNHMEAHLLSSFAKNSNNNNYELRITNDQFPLLGFLLSGGHTELVLMKDFGNYEVVGETLDDAVGEAFDKTAKMLELGYPGGPIVEQLAKSGDPKKYPLPVPMKGRKDLNFSFSGLKTAVLYLVKRLKEENGQLTKQQMTDICASFQVAATKSLVDKLTMAINQHQPHGILLGGGVISNLYVRNQLREAVNNLPIFIPYSKKLFTDNAGMVGVCAYYQAKRDDFVKDIETLDRMPSLRF